MKKLMIAAVVVSAAVVSQAAAITWGSGFLKGPESWESSGSVSPGSVNLNKIAGTWDVALQIYADIACETLVASDSIRWTSDGTGATGVRTDTSATKPSSGGTVANTFTSPAGFKVTSDKWTSLADGTTYYAVLSVTGTKADGSTATKTSAATAITTMTSPSATASFNATTTSLISGWKEMDWTVTAAPEPTSGLLLLLGMAGLSLRRRRA